MFFFGTTDGSLRRNRFEKTLKNLICSPTRFTRYARVSQTGEPVRRDGENEQNITETRGRFALSALSPIVRPVAETDRQRFVFDVRANKTVLSRRSAVDDVFFSALLLVVVVWTALGGPMGHISGSSLLRVEGIDFQGHA